jgi:hypothetical protein
MFEMIPKKAQPISHPATSDVATSSHVRVKAVNVTKILKTPESDWEARAILRRIHAGIWAARTALVLSVPFAITAWARGADHAWFIYMLLPTVAAFFSGVFVGAAICNREEVTDESLAGRRGALVALFAYVLFAVEVAALSSTPLESGLNALMGSLLMSGWAVFPVSFLAGILAFRAREGAHRFKRPAES